MPSTRRLILAATALTPMLWGCTAAQAQSTLQTITSGLSTLPGLISAAGINLSASVQADVTKALADLQSNTASIVTAVGAPPATVTQIIGDITTIASLVTPFYPQAPAIAALVGAAVSLVGTLLTEAGVTGAVQGMPTHPMPKAMALAILKAAAGK